MVLLYEGRASFEVNSLLTQRGWSTVWARRPDFFPELKLGSTLLRISACGFEFVCFAGDVASFRPLGLSYLPLA